MFCGGHFWHGIDFLANKNLRQDFGGTIACNTSSL
jgi:hypothetical protein